MFRGRFEHSIDGKGRTSLPSRFREVISAQTDPRVVVTTGLETCLVVYSMAEWIAFEERLSRLPQFDASAAMVRRIYVSAAVECEMDKLGRILLPHNLREHANLTNRVLWAGMGRYVELWSVEGFDALKRSVLDDGHARLDMARRLAELGL